MLLSATRWPTFPFLQLMQTVTRSRGSTDSDHQGPCPGCAIQIPFWAQRLQERGEYYSLAQWHSVLQWVQFVFDPAQLLVRLINLKPLMPKGGLKF
jgi:hypothetical protein